MKKIRITLLLALVFVNPLATMASTQTCRIWVDEYANAKKINEPLFRQLKAFAQSPNGDCEVIPVNRKTWKTVTQPNDLILQTSFNDERGYYSPVSATHRAHLKITLYQVVQSPDQQSQYYKPLISTYRASAIYWHKKNAYEEVIRRALLEFEPFSSYVNHTNRWIRLSSTPATKLENNDEIGENYWSTH
jgi:hypothetical protein